MSKDTIYRQAAIDALKRKTFRLTFAEEQNCEGHVAWSADAVYSDVMEGELLELPSAQPEIIRCKDCKHRPTSTEADGHIEQGFSLEFPDNVCPCQCEDGWYNWYPSDDFYCGRAERREDALN